MTIDIADVIKRSFVTLFTERLIFALAVMYTIIGVLFDFLVSSLNLPQITSASIASTAPYTASLEYVAIYAIFFIIFTLFVQEIVFIKVYTKRKGISSIIVMAARRFPYFLATNILAAVIVILGLVAFIIPGIYLAFRLLLAPVSSVVEKNGPLSALQRSWEISEGKWWNLFALFLLLGIIAGMLGLIPYVSYFFNFLIIIAYPIVLLQLVPRKRGKRKNVRHSVR